ncbi:MAG TPA: TonB-dependent receptor [Bacteroidota bacterium]|nr:TonB-dependent receptor [Bacteroidota bacterium]
MDQNQSWCNRSIRRTQMRLMWIVMVFAIVCSWQGAQAQGSGTLKGRILDNEGGPLPAAIVVVKGTTIGAAADIDGYYTVRNVPAGKQTIKVSYLGYDGVENEVTIVNGSTVVRNFRLVAKALEGEVVVITAQARGQNQAINQQLESNTISNIVSSDRIKELPDVNAAESIGRLPGVSINRYGGEATAVAIRGLSPKYNTITVNGVALPATSNNDRSVDLSLVASNMLDGIELKKANTPDMDADALGGTVDLRLKEAPEQLQIDAMLQGGYNQLLNTRSNYAMNLTASNRFFDGDLGLIAGFNADRNNRSGDQLNSSYRANAANQTLSDIFVENLTLQAINAYKKRIGGSLLMDYRIPEGKITATGFYNKSTTDRTSRSDNMSFSHNSHYYTVQNSLSSSSMYTSSLGMKQDFGWIKYDVSGAATGSMNDDPNNMEYQLTQENKGASGVPTAAMALTDVHALENVDTLGTGLSQILRNSYRLNEKQKMLQFNTQIPFQLSDNLTGFVKFGGKARWLDRVFDQNQYGAQGLQYGGGWSGTMSNMIHRAAEMYPGDFNATSDSTLIAAHHWWPATRFLTPFNRSNFLDNQYNMGMTFDLDLMTKLGNALKTLPPTDWKRLAIGSFGNDYDGIERYQSAYIMSEINIGPQITFTPGVRYDADFSRYHGQSFREITPVGNVEQLPGDIKMNENERRNSFWLPMVHLKLQPVNWLIVRLASTQTVTRPDYSMYAPISHINSYQSYIFAANGGLKDSRSKNLDASVSIYQNYIGFLTVSGFKKTIDNLIMYTTVPKMDTSVAKLMPTELNIPKDWLAGAPQVDTYINNPTPAVYKGIELDWQTNFWYLPSFLKGIVLNINWTYITSTIDVRQFKTTPVTRFVPPRSYVTTIALSDTIRTDRMPDQPAHIANITIGYDYKGFSIRASYLSQSDKVTGIGQTPITDAFTAPYKRWDLAVQQKVDDHLQLYANFNNLNNRHDESLLGYRQVNPTALEYYGFTIDLGLRYKF